MNLQLDEIPEAIRLLNATYPDSEISFTVSLRAPSLGDYIFAQVKDSTGGTQSSVDADSPLAHAKAVIKDHGPAVSRVALIRKEIEAKEKEIADLKKQADPLLLAMDKVLEKGGV